MSEVGTPLDFYLQALDSSISALQLKQTQSDVPTDVEASAVIQVPLHQYRSLFEYFGNDLTIERGYVNPEFLPQFNVAYASLFADAILVPDGTISLMNDSLNDLVHKIFGNNDSIDQFTNVDAWKVWFATQCYQSLQSIHTTLSTISYTGTDARLQQDASGNSFFPGNLDLDENVVVQLFKQLVTFNPVRLQHITSKTAFPFISGDTLCFKLTVNYDTLQLCIFDPSISILPRTYMIRLQLMDIPDINLSGFPEPSIQTTQLTLLNSPGFVVLPSNIETISSNACANSSIISVTSPSVILVQMQAFLNCQYLRYLDLSHIVTIERDAFKGCTALQSVNFATATDVGDSAFENCTSLVDVALPLLQTLPNKCFMNCSALEEIILENLEAIGNHAFDGCTALHTALFPSLTTLGRNAFANCTSLLNVYIGTVLDVPIECFLNCASLMYLDVSSHFYGQDAFKGCTSLQYVISDIVDSNEGCFDNYYHFINGTVTIIAGSTHIIPAMYKNVSITAIGSSTFKTFREVTLPSSVTLLENDVFKNCTLEFIVAPGVLWVGENAFDGCVRLSSVQMSSVVSIDRFAFQNCENLVNLNIPTVTSFFADSTFLGCTNLENLDCSNLLSARSDVLEGCPKLVSITLPDTVSLLTNALRTSSTPDDGEFIMSEDGSTILGYKGYPGDGLQIDYPVTKIGPHAFYGCVFDGINLACVTEISNDAFKNCTLLDIDAPVVHIVGSNAFQGCTNLKTVSLPFATSLGVDAFESDVFISAPVTIIPDLNVAHFPIEMTFEEVNFHEVMLTHAEFNFNGKGILPSVIYSSTGIKQTIIGITASAITHQDLDLTIPYTYTNISATYSSVQVSFLRYNGPAELSNLNAISYFDTYSLAQIMLILDNKTLFIPKFVGNELYTGINVTSLQKTNFKVLYAPYLTYIGKSVFKNNNELRELEIPSVDLIQESAFENTGLTQLNISARYILSRAFANCTSLKSVSLPNALFIASDAFEGCEIDNVYVSPISIPTELQISSVIFTLVPDIIFEIDANGTLLLCSNAIGEITLPVTVQRIADFVFKNNYGVTKISAANCTSVGVSALACATLSSVDLPLVSDVSDNAFRGSNLTEIYLQGLTSAGAYAFAETPLSLVEFPLLSTIPTTMFYQCNELQYVSMKSTLEVSANLFSGNLTMVNFTLTGSAPNIIQQAVLEESENHVTLQSCVCVGDAVIPPNILLGGDKRQISTIAANCFSNQVITSINAPYIVNIGDNAFSGTSLSLVTFESLNFLGKNVFLNTPILEFSAPNLKRLSDQSFTSTLRNVYVPTLLSLHIDAFSEPPDNLTVPQSIKILTSVSETINSGVYLASTFITVTLKPTPIFTYAVNDTFVQITGVENAVGELILPETYNDLPVTSFDFNFSTTYLNESGVVMTSPGVQEVNRIVGLNIEQINVTCINPNLQSIRFPKLRAIPANAFLDHTKLEIIDVSSEIVCENYIIGEGAFVNCSALKTFACPESASRCTINTNSFMNCLALTTFSCNVPLRVFATSFTNCPSLTYFAAPFMLDAGLLVTSEVNLKNVVLPEFQYDPLTVNNWANATFEEHDDGTACLVDASTIQAANAVIPSTYNRKPVRRIKAGAFLENVWISSISGDSIQIIETNAFVNCAILARVSFANVSTLQSNAFLSCDALLRVYLPECVCLHNLAFQSCTVPFIYIPKALPYVNCQLTSMGNLGCSPTAIVAPKNKYTAPSTQIYQLVLKSTNNYILSHVQNAFGEIQLPYFDEFIISEIGIGCFANTDIITLNTNNPEAIQGNRSYYAYIRAHAFSNCQQLTTIRSDTITYINPTAFYGISAPAILKTPLFTLTPTHVDLILNQPYSSLFQINSSVDAVYTISPSVFGGFSFNGTSLSCIPDFLLDNFIFTITATNAAGSYSQDFKVSVISNAIIPPRFQLSVSSVNLFTNTSLTSSPYTITRLNSVIINNYSISPTLPIGLTMSSVTGLLSGTPTEPLLSTTFTITAHSDTSTHTENITISVSDTPRFQLSVSSVNLFTNTSLTSSPYTITRLNSVIINNYSISPTLPIGLTMSSVTGLLSGTPTEPLLSTTFTITAHSDTSTHTENITISVSDTPLSAPNFTFSTWGEVLTVGSAISSYTITHTGGTVDYYEISPLPLQAALTFNASTGILSGVVSAASNTTYYITGYNSLGIHWISYTIVVNN